MMLYVTLVSMLLLFSIQDSSAGLEHHDDNPSVIPSDLATEHGIVEASAKGHATVANHGHTESKASATADASTFVNYAGVLPSSQPVRRFVRQQPASYLHSQRNLNYGVGGNNNGYVGSQNEGHSGDNKVSNGVGGGNVSRRRQS